MEPIPEPTNFKSMATVLWIALITAIVVTIIDWKIKQDILRLTDAFYRVYPSTMEQQHAGQANHNKNGIRRPHPGPVLPVPVVDSDSRVEAENAAPSPRADAEDHSSDWARYAPDIKTGLES